MEEAMNSGIQYDFIDHISGQCHPIKPIQTIYNFFDKHKEKNFLSCEPAPSEWWDEKKQGYENYHFQDFNFNGRFRLGMLLTKLLPRRKLPFLYTLYGSPLGAYWTIRTEVAAFLVDYFHKYRRVRNFFKFSWGPDEFLFNTIIMNSDFRNNVINNNYRYIDWSEKKPHPKILTHKDFEKLKQSDCFFARKFDLTVDSKILELIHNNILS